MMEEENNRDEGIHMSVQSKSKQPPKREPFAGKERQSKPYGAGCELKQAEELANTADFNIYKDRLVIISVRRKLKVNSMFIEDKLHWMKCSPKQLIRITVQCIYVLQLWGVWEMINMGDGII